MCAVCNNSKFYRETDFSHDEYIRNKAIDEFAERLKEKSSDILIWLMERQEAGYGTSNGELHDKWLSKIDEMAKQMKGE